MTSVVLEWLGRTSIDVALLIAVVVLVLRLFGKRLGARWSFALWTIVILRLCLPTLPVLRPSSTDLPRALLEPASELGSVARFAVTRRPAEALPRKTPAIDVEPDPVSGRKLASVPSPSVLAEHVEHPREESEPDWPAWILGAWLLGGGLVLVRSLRQEWLFRRALKDARPITDERIHGILQKAARAMGVAPPALLSTASVSAPALFGIRRPRLLLPLDATATLSQSEIELVLLHELAHAKHRDVVKNFGLVLLRAIWWFHPLAQWALVEFDRARESVRDAEALEIAGRTRTHAYAATLVKLVQSVPSRIRSPHAVGFFHGRHLERRIQMIARFDKPSARALGFVLLVVVGGFGLTSAARTAEAPLDARGEQLQRIEVERPEVPAWRSQMLQRLNRPIELHVEEAGISTVIGELRKVSGLNFVLLPSAFEGANDEGLEFKFHHSGATLEVLEALRSTDECLDFVIDENLVVIGPRYELPNAFEVGFYRLRPLLDQVSGFPEDTYGVHDILDLVYEFTTLEDSYDWDAEGVWVDVWQDVLVVNHCDWMHERVERFLNRLLNSGLEPDVAVDPRRRRIDELLSQPGSVQFEDLSLISAFVQFSEQSQVPVTISQDSLDDLEFEPISLTLTDVSYRRILDWLVSFAEAFVRYENGGLLVDDRPELRLEFYAVGDLLRAMRNSDSVEEDWEPNEYVTELLRNQIDVESWESFENVRMEFFGDSLIVNQSAAVHAQIGPQLASLERAFRP